MKEEIIQKSFRKRNNNEGNNPFEREVLQVEGMRVGVTSIKTWKELVMSNTLGYAVTENLHLNK